MPSRATLRRAAGAASPASGGIVMGTGIVSAALALDGHRTWSHVLLALTGASWAALGVLMAARALTDRPGLIRDARTPAAFTGVAGTAVLGTRLAVVGWTWVPAALLAVAAGLWVLLIGPVLRSWTSPTVGASFLIVVATQSLCVLSATIAGEEHAHWLLWTAVLPFALGLALYLFVARSFRLRELAVGPGDQWVTGGALAISTLAAGRLVQEGDRLGVVHGTPAAARTAVIALWVLTLLWLPALLLAEARWPRTGYDVRRWSTVFPLGMYAACSFTVGTVARLPAATDFARVWTWVALITWAAVAAGLARSQASPPPRAGPPPASAGRAGCSPR